ncbi:MAG: hypothetical protein ACK5WX_00215, partial [bacterium]
MPATRIPIDIPNAPTSLLIERGAVVRLGEVLAREGVRVGDRAVLLVVDEAVRSTHGARAVAALSSAGARVNMVPSVAQDRAQSWRGVERSWA